MPSSSRVQRRRMRPGGGADDHVLPEPCWLCLILLCAVGTHPRHWGDSGLLRFPLQGSSSTQRWKNYLHRRFHGVLPTRRGSAAKSVRVFCLTQHRLLWLHPHTWTPLFVTGADLFSFSGTWLSSKEGAEADPVSLLPPPTTRFGAT